MNSNHVLRDKFLAIMVGNPNQKQEATATLAPGLEMEAGLPK